MVFRVPPDSLAHRYSEAYREFTWEKVRGASGVKILPNVRNQDGPTCIYEAVATWMETQLRLRGITIQLSSKDLKKREEELVSEEKDRTMRCLKILKSIGMCSEDDFISQNPYATFYKMNNTFSFFSLYESDFREAIRRMKKSPLLVVFHVDVNYYDYVTKFHQRPILSYEKYEEGRMEGHAACNIGYGTESIVPFWKFMNSVGRRPPTKGLGRLLPQNAIYLIAPGELEIYNPLAPPAPPVAPPAPVEAAAPVEVAAPVEAAALREKRKRHQFEHDDIEVDADVRLPAMKKQKVRDPQFMDQDNILPF